MQHYQGPQKSWDHVLDIFHDLSGPQTKEFFQAIGTRPKPWFLINHCSLGFQVFGKHHGILCGNYIAQILGLLAYSHLQMSSDPSRHHSYSGEQPILNLGSYQDIPPHNCYNGDRLKNRTKEAPAPKPSVALRTIEPEVGHLRKEGRSKIREKAVHRFNKPVQGEVGGELK